MQNKHSKTGNEYPFCNQKKDDNITIEKRGPAEPDLIRLKHSEHHETVGYPTDVSWKVSNRNNSRAQNSRARARLQDLVVNWQPRKHASKPKDGIALAGKDSFSYAFSSAFSMSNATNIYGLDDDLTKAAVFEALLEREASCQFASGSNANLHALLNIKESHGRESMTVSGELGPDNELRWALNHGRTTGTTWTRLLCMIFNLSRMDALATLANILSMSFDNLSKLSSDRHAAEFNGGSRPIEDVPAFLQLPGLPAGSACAELMEKKYIYGNADQIIGAILRYRLNENDFCLPATVGRGVLCMGKYKPTAHFLNQHLMDQHPFAPVIFFQDMRTALAFERMLGEARGYDSEKFIVTAHLGDDLSVLSWNYFHNHEVVFIPAPTKECLAMVKPYKDHITGAQAKSFQVYSGFLLHSQPDCALIGPVEGTTDAEEELLHKTVWLDTVERPTRLMEQVVKQGVYYDEFMAWGQKLGIFKKPKEQNNYNETTSFNSLSLFQPHIGLATPLTNVTDVTTKQIVVPGGITLLHGLKDSGKSITCVSAAKAIITGGGLFDIFTAGESRNILYLDSETPQDLLTARLGQLGLVGEIGNRLFLLSKFDLRGNDLAFSITDQKFRDYVEEIMREQNCGYLVLDNLTSLMDDGSLYHPTTVSKFFEDWIGSLTRQGIGVVMVSHTQEGPDAGTPAATARGCKEFSIRAHSEIVLVRSTEILEKKLGPEAVQHMAAQDGLTVGICFKVCKSACVLQKKIFWLHLPLGASQWEFLSVTGVDGKEIEFAQVCSKPEPDPTVKDEPLLDAPKSGDITVLDQLSSDEKSVYDMAQTAGSVKTADITKKLGCSDRTARNLTKSLEERGLLEPNGNFGPQQGYRVKN